MTQLNESPANPGRFSHAVRTALADRKDDRGRIDMGRHGVPGGRASCGPRSAEFH